MSKAIATLHPQEDALKAFNNNIFSDKQLDIVIECLTHTVITMREFDSPESIVVRYYEHKLRIAREIQESRKS